MVQRVEQPRARRIRETQDCQGSKMLIAQPRLYASGQRRVGQQGVEVDRRLRHGDGVVAAGDRSVQVGQGLGVVEGADLRHEAGQEIENAVAGGDEGRKLLTPIAALYRTRPLDQSALGAADLIGGRQEEQGQMTAAFEVLVAPTVELRAALFVDQPRGRIGKSAVGIAEGGDTFGVEEQCPTGAEPPQGVVGAGADRHQFGLGRTFKIGSAKVEGALEAAVLVQHHAGSDQGRPREMIGQAIGAVAVLAQVQHASHPF